jgi:hypothetical protein
MCVDKWRQAGDIENERQRQTEKGKGNLHSHWKVENEAKADRLKKPHKGVEYGPPEGI